MTDVKKTDEKKVYRFVSRGNCTINLRSSYKEAIYNELGKPISEKRVPALSAVFNHGHFETTDKDVVLLLENHPGWGSEIFYDPTSLPNDAGPEEKTMAKSLKDAEFRRKKEQKERRERAKEGNIPREQ